MGFVGDCLGTLFDVMREQAIFSGAAYVKDQVARFRFDDSLPRNAHIRYAIADSHIRALRRLIEQFETELDRQAERADSDSASAADIEQGRQFCRAARRVVHSNRTIYLDPTTVSATFSEGEGNKVFDTLLSTSFLDEREKVGDGWVREAAWKRLLSSTGYDEAMVPEGFRSMFNSPVSGYMANFAHCFRDRLKDPQNTEVFQITTALSLGQVRELLEVRWTGVEAALERQRSTLDQLRGRLELGQRTKVLSRPRLERKESPGSPASAFRYDRAIDDLVGREAELFAVERGFLAPLEPEDRSSLFRWQVLCGDAGAGKSRFAMELMNRVEDYWPLGGFLDAANATTDLSWLDDLDRAAFIVIDYAGGRAGVTDLLKAFGNAAREGALKAPVRILLVERRPDDPIFTSLFDIESLRDFGPSSEAEFIKLRQLDDTAIVTLMRGRLAERSADFSDDELLQHLVDFDKRKRPLFAAIVAAFLRTETLPEIDRDASAEQARWKLFHTLIRIWRERIWAAGTSHDGIEPYERLAALATFVKGLETRHHYGLAGRTDLPALEDRTSEYLSRILGPMLLVDKRSGNYVYPAMEPDLAGECFVLGQWMMADGVNLKPMAHLHAQAMASLAWELMPWKAADFARRCYQSYPSAAFAVGYLIPAEVPRHALLAKAMAVASIIAEYITRHRAKADAQGEVRSEAPTVDEQSELLELHDLFDPAIHAAAETDIEIARTLARSTRQVINFLAHAINDQMGWVDANVAQTLSDIAEGRTEEAPSDSRSAFNTGATGARRVLH